MAKSGQRPLKRSTKMWKIEDQLNEGKKIYVLKIEKKIFNQMKYVNKFIKIYKFTIL